MHAYLFELCKTDGSTPLGQCPMYEVSAADERQARGIVLRAVPGHEVVSWGLRTEIEAFRRQMGWPPCAPTIIDMPKQDAL